MQRLHARQVTSTERKPSDNYALVKYSAPPNFTVKYLRGKREKRTWELIWGARRKVWKCKSTVDSTEPNSKGRHERETHLCMNRWKCQIFFFFCIESQLYYDKLYTTPVREQHGCHMENLQSPTFLLYWLQATRCFSTARQNMSDIVCKQEKKQNRNKKGKKKWNTNSIGICKFLFSIARL